MATINVELCHCMHVTSADVEYALRESKSLDSVMDAFHKVQQVTHCSTGCGKCHDKIVDTISEMLYDLV